MSDWWIRLIIALWLPQMALIPAHVREGDSVESQFRSYRDDLDRFYGSLSEAVSREAPGLLVDLADDAPPEPVVYGYQLLPPLDPSTALMPSGDRSPSVRSYSWPLTRGYIDAERERLRRADMRLDALAGTRDVERYGDLVGEYHVLVANQGTIDQHVQYNRFWQRSVEENREKFDRLDELYDLMTAGDPETTSAIRDVLGHPAVPSFVTLRNDAGSVVVQLPIWTDIEDRAYIGRIEAIAEREWQALDRGKQYRLDVLFRVVAPASLYGSGTSPRRGDHLDLGRHVELFDDDGAVLTTGAESTHALVGRAVLLGAGTVTSRIIAHEVGHLLGFPDGYVRGYEDLGDQGFEIREVTSEFDDIMTAPHSGGVRATHFELIVERVGERVGAR